MIDVLSVNGVKELLLNMTPGERSVFLLMGYSSNQVSVLWKLVDIGTNRTPENHFERRVSGAQNQVIIRLLIGVLRETWRLVEGRFLGSNLGREYVPTLDQPAREAIERLKKAFLDPMLTDVRNDYVFHYPRHDEMEAAFQRALKNEDTEAADWGIFLSHKLYNSFFFISEFVFAHGLIAPTKEADLNTAYMKLLGALAPIANDLSEVTFGFAAALFRKYIGNELAMTVVAKIKDAPNINDLWIPFYVEIHG